MKDILCFVNKLDFADKLNNDDLEKLAEIKKVVVRKLEGYKLSKEYMR